MQKEVKRLKKVFLSKTRYCRAVQCEKMLWLDVNKPECAEDLGNEEILRNGTKVGILAKGLLGNYIDIEYNSNKRIMVEDTKKYLMQPPNVITEASFEYDGNFCSVDILKNDFDGVEVYEVKSSTEVKDIYLDDISYQVHLIQSLGHKVKKACIVHINSEYERHGELELNKLFKIVDVTDIVNSKQEEITNKIVEIRKYMEQTDEPTDDIGMKCFNPYQCAYWSYCTRNLPDNNVFKVRGMKLKNKFKLYNNGVIDFKDLENEKLNDRYLEQIEYEIKEKEDKINQEKINEFLSKLYYPLYFLDFETYHQAVPEYDGIRPYMQIPFQYSLHYIQNENGELMHKEFLAEAGEDPRRKLAERLVEDIPANACVLAYNMRFEKGIIKNLANIFSDLREKLMKTHDNIFDLMEPFSKRDYYVGAMHGSYSIKYVLPALFPDDKDLDYKALPVVHNGGEAMQVFAELGEKPKEEQEVIRKGLLEYCKLDTLAMVKIWEKLNELSKK